MGCREKQDEGVNVRPTTPPTTLRLLFTAVAVVLGVLGMHVLSSGAHVSGGLAHSPAQVLTPDNDERAGGQPILHGLLRDGIATASALSDLPDAPLDALTAICLAVLLGVAVVLGVRTSRRERGPASCWPPRATILRLLQLTRAPPPDLLTRLCVLRT